MTKLWPLTWKPRDSSLPFIREEGVGEFARELDLEFGLELDLDEACEREAEVGRELGREPGEESALVILDKGAKIPDERHKVLFTD